MENTSTPEKRNKFNLFEKALALVVFAFLLLIWLCDRTVHIILFHKEHKRFVDWANNKDERKFAIARIFIFTLPVIIYKILF